MRIVVAGMQCVRRSYSLLRTCRIRAGVCSANISSAIWEMSASKSGGGIAVSSLTTSLRTYQQCPLSEPRQKITHFCA